MKVHVFFTGSYMCFTLEDVQNSKILTIFIYFFLPLCDEQVQFQKVQQLRLTQSRAQYYGSLPNVNQIGNTSTEFQVGFRFCTEQ